MNESADRNATEAGPTETPSGVAPGFREMRWGDRFAVACGTGLGIGFLPRAPGTFGSLLGPPLIMAVQQLNPTGPMLSLLGGVFVLAGIPICSRASTALGRHDPGQVVYDEVAAFWLVFLPQLLTATPVTWPQAVIGFLLFRFFDISKLWPMSRLEKLPGGIGIMADDLAAGLMAGALLFMLPV